MSKLVRFSCFLLSALGVFASLAKAQMVSPFPGQIGSDPWTHRPNDPSYGAMWQLFSHLPVEHTGVISDAERAMGAGMHVDEAWQYHTGTPETVIAILDSGINWDTYDLIDRAFLNRRELPLPLGSEVFDKNGDGRFSVSDYRDDPRVSDLNHNGTLDAGDLIRAFSNGIDEDGNGFVDDISGWDFHEHDNDPGDRIKFGHGTGEAKDSVAALNNGYGGAGICGNCTFIMLRVNDSFVVDANAFSAGIYYATDMGVSLVQQALGSADANETTQAAVDYAYDHNLVIIGSAADENSYHHNYPSTLDPVVYTNSIRFDSKDVFDATSFLAFNNCSNFGARVDVATSGRSCSSEATANLAGITGLTLSYAHSLGMTLSAGEVISLIKTSATDINLGSNILEPWRYSTYQGWDTMTGYGRTNAIAMIKAVRQGHIPPEARILTPGWFDLVKADQDERVPISIKAARPRSGRMRVKLAVAAGVETSGAPFQLVADSGIRSEGIDGIFASLSLAALASLPRVTLDMTQFRNAYTLLLTVDDLAGQVAEARRTFYVQPDANLVAGFPSRMPGSGESSGFFQDLNGDGRQEFITADGAGYVHAFSSLIPGGELPGFPVNTVLSRYDSSAMHGTRPMHSAFTAGLAGGDLDGDGTIEIVGISLEGDVSVIEPNGDMRAGFPKTLPFPDMSQVTTDDVIAQGSLSTPVLVDLDLDGALEIVLTAMDGKLHVYRADGTSQPGFPLSMEVDGHAAKILSSPAVADIDADGYPDLIFGSNHVGDAAGYIFAVNAHGSLALHPVVSGFPVRVPMIKDHILPTVGTGVPTAPVVGDIDGDGQSEILVHAFVGKIYAFNFDGSLKKSFGIEVGPEQETNDEFMIPAFGHPALGDLDGDGVLSPVTVGVGQRMLVSMLLGGRRYEYQDMVGAWDGRTGLMRRGFPRRIEDMPMATSPLIADLDHDGKSDIVAGSGGYFIHGWTQKNGTWREADGFPVFTGGWLFGTPSFGDFDGDGKLELAATTREGNVLIWHTQGLVSDNLGAGKWLTFKGNPQRTGGNDNAKSKGKPSDRH